MLTLQIVESCVEGVRKPDPSIFRTLSARSGVAPARTIFLDDIAANLKTAKALGFTTILVRNPLPSAALKDPKLADTPQYKWSGFAALDELSTFVQFDVLAEFRAATPSFPRQPIAVAPATTVRSKL